MGNLRHLIVTTKSIPSWKSSGEATGQQTLEVNYSNERQWIEISIEETAKSIKTGKYHSKFTMITLTKENVELFKTFIKAMK